MCNFEHFNYYDAPNGLNMSFLTNMLHFLMYMYTVELVVKDHPIWL